MDQEYKEDGFLLNNSLPIKLAIMYHIANYIDVKTILSQKKTKIVTVSSNDIM